MRRKSNPQRFRKRQATNLPDHDPASSVLRGLHDLVQRGRYAEALAQIDQLVGGSPPLPFKAALLALAADCLFKQGKFDEAATAYASVSQLVQDQPTLWLRPALGEVRSRLNDGQTAEAANLGSEAVQRAAAFEQQYQNLLAQANATVTAGGQATIPAQPPRTSTVASRLGRYFLSAGEPDQAKALFQQALQVNPNGACRARLGLAEIALRQDDPTTCLSLARGAILLGQYQAKTLPGWTLLLAAARRTGTDTLDATLLSGLAQATASVRARAVLLLARGLRNQNDPRWQQLAANWLQQEGQTNPVIAAELRKLTFAQASRVSAPATTQLQAAQDLIQTPNLGPTEWLAAAKTTVRNTLLLNQTPDIASLIAQGVSQYGPAFQGVIAHGLARACRAANRPDLAQPLLQQNLATLPVGSEAWAKSLWALARLAASQGNPTQAAAYYWQYSQQSGLLQRFRLYALLEWTRAIAAANQPDQLAQAKPQLDAALPQITDYELVLDLARQVLYSQLGRAFALQVFQRGQQLALQAFDACPHPSPAATILYKLARRANDLLQYDAILASWSRLSTDQQQWVWSERSDFWCYLELVFRAWRDSQKPAQAEQFIAPYLNDPATPPHGYAILGVSYAALKRNQGDLATMFAVYEKMAQVAPTYEWTSVAYYWFALRARKQGNAAQAAAFADRMLLALGNDWTMYWKTDMAACALCLKAGLEISQVPAQVSASADRLRAQLENIQADLARLTL
jgi:tetratricopeptide (TPR) repeat protein